MTSTVVDALAVDITFFDADGKAVEPQNGKEVHVALSSKQSVSGDDHTVIHVEKNGNADAMTVNEVESSSADFNAKSFSIYAIIGTKEHTARRTYRFFDIEKKLLSSQIICNGDSLTEPSIPTTDDNTVFVGWSQDAGKSYQQFGIINDIDNTASDSTVDLYPVFKKQYSVNFHDQNGAVVQRQSCASGEVIHLDDYSFEVAAGDYVSGWTAVQGSTVKIGGDQNIITVESQDVDLYPIIKNVSWIIFHGNDTKDNAASYTTPVYTKENELVTKPSDPTRKGYTFTGWNTKEDGTGSVFDFNAPVANTIDLYAQWEKAETTYRVLNWHESLDGSYDTIGSYDFFDYKDMKGITGSDAVYDLETAEGFELDQEKTDNAAVIINANGSTVRNVYYKRKRFTLVFQEGNTKCAAKGTIYRTDKVIYGQDISSIIHQLAAQGLCENGTIWMGSWMQGEWLTILDNSPMSLDEDITIHNTNKDSYTGIFTHNLHGGWSKTAYYYNEILPGASTEGQDIRTFNGKQFEYFSKLVMVGGWGLCEIYNKGDQDLANGFGFYDIEGDGARRYNERYKATLYWWKNYKDDQGNMCAEPMYVYFSRNSYQITFMNTSVDKAVAPIDALCGESLSGKAPKEYVVDQTTQTINDRTYIFKGWYDNAAFAGNPFQFDGTMPTENFVLYAKWEAIKVNVTFDSNGGSTIDPQKIDQGTEAYAPEAPVRDGYQFAGWVNTDGSLFNFSTDIFADTTLTARWISTESIRINYDANGGSGEPIDENLYMDVVNATVKSSPASNPEGKYFYGWSLNGKLYRPGETFMVKSSDAQLIDRQYVITLSAVYGNEPAKTVVIYDKNDGSGVRKVLSGENNADETAADLSVLQFSIPSTMIFNGWNTKKDGSGTAYAVGETIVVNNHEPLPNVLYAQWTNMPKRSVTPVTTDTNGTSQTRSSTPRTGDSTNSPLAAGIMILSILCAGCTFLIRRKYSE